jgi:hypothetical protein
MNERFFVYLDYMILHDIVPVKLFTPRMHLEFE